MDGLCGCFSALVLANSTCRQDLINGVYISIDVASASDVSPSTVGYELAGQDERPIALGNSEYRCPIRSRR